MIETMHHQTIDPRTWIERYPLEAHLLELDSENRPAFVYHPPHDVFTAKQLAHTLQYLQRATKAKRPRRTTPIDLFLPALGEPPQRHETKIAGLPFLRERDWPRNEQGFPLAFFGQICFADSLDILPFPREKLGGDVLLIFQDHPEELIWRREHGAQLTFLWMDLGIKEADLVNAQDSFVPPGWHEPTHYHRLRAVEYPGYAKKIRHRSHPILVDGCFRATKLGGSPVWQQDEQDGSGLGTYFGCIHSINPYGREYPLINLPEAPWRGGYSDRNLLMLGDVGTLYLFLGDGGQIDWVMQCG